MQSCKCDRCGAELSFDENNRDYIICEYCGAKKILDDYRYVVVHRDEAELKRAETDDMVKRKEIEWKDADRAREEEERNREYTKKRIEFAYEQRRKKLNLYIKIISVVGAVIFIGLGMLFFRNNKTETLGSILFLVGVGVAVLAFIYIPKKLAEKAALDKGGIRFPTGLNDLNDKNIEAVTTTLSNMGFKNISTISLHDVILGLFQKADVVENIMIDGEKAQGGKVYLPDAHIVITYHGR